MNEKGEGFQGNFDGNFDASKQTFKFRNHSNGKEQMVEIRKLQKLDINRKSPTKELKYLIIYYRLKNGDMFDSYIKKISDCRRLQL